jgi:pyruvate dehydrogenase phosphatase regulatory subunit
LFFLLSRVYNCPEAFSPDCKWILGESPEIQNYFVVAGMKTVGIAAAGGAGRAIADIITQGNIERQRKELLLYVS